MPRVDLRRFHDEPEPRPDIGAAVCGRGWHRVVDGRCEVVDVWDTGEVRHIPICPPVRDHRDTRQR